MRKYRSFEEARAIVQSLKLANQNDWRKYSKSVDKPNDIPTNPDRVYKDKGWTSWGDWLGTRNRKGEWLPFVEARAFVHRLNIKNQNDWVKYCKSENKPVNIPANPLNIYKNNGWMSFGDWLGTHLIANQLKKYRACEEAREFVHSLKLRSRKEWNEYCKGGNKSEDIPINPDRVYQDKGWISWGEWLGSGNRKGGWLQFEEARTFVHSLNLKNQNEWKLYCKNKDKLENIPANPSVYKNKGWTSWGDWLGTGKIANTYKKYRAFEEAREFVHSLRLRSRNEWNEYCKGGNKPEDIPSSSNAVYKDKGWTGWGDWLGTKKH